MAHTFEELIVKVSAAHVIVDEAAKISLEAAAEKVKKTAEDKFGTYQPSYGNFPAWAVLNSAYLARKIAAGGSESPLIGAPSLNQVWSTPLKDTIEYTVNNLRAHIGTDDPLGEWHEYGLLSRKTPLPPRPFLRPALYQNKDQIKKDIGAAIGAALVTYFK